jgi:hypothetical protein
MTARSGPLPLQVPSWVPPIVAELARRTWLSNKSKVERKGPVPPYIEHADKLLNRLVCDKRMRRVWRELSRRRRDGEFMYPAKGSEPEKDKDTRQNEAMVLLFCQSAVRALLSQREEVVTCQKAEQRHKELLDKAKQLRVDANGLFLQSIYRSPLSSSTLSYCDLVQRLRDLDHAAQILESYAAENLVFEMKTALKRDRGDGDIRWTALGLAETCRILFDSPLYGVTATIMSVALGRDINTRTVRQWCAHPADKPPKSTR